MEAQNPNHWTAREFPVYLCSCELNLSSKSEFPRLSLPLPRPSKSHSIGVEDPKNICRGTGPKHGCQEALRPKDPRSRKGWRGLELVRTGFLGESRQLLGCR